jgi:hypothetical protein
MRANKKPSANHKWFTRNMTSADSGAQLINYTHKHQAVQQQQQQQQHSLLSQASTRQFAAKNKFPTVDEYQKVLRENGPMLK